MRQINIRKKVAICGANGFIGENFCKFFSEKYDVIGLIRKRNRDKGNENNIKIVRPSFGLHPKYYNFILNKKSKKKLQVGDRFKLEYVKKK